MQSTYIGICIIKWISQQYKLQSPELIGLIDVRREYNMQINLTATFGIGISVHLEALGIESTVEEYFYFCCYTAVCYSQ